MILFWIFKLIYCMALLNSETCLEWRHGGHDVTRPKAKVEFALHSLSLNIRLGNFNILKSRGGATKLRGLVSHNSFKIGIAVTSVLSN